MSRTAFINNEFVQEAQAVLSVKDLALQRGYGVFDFFRLQGNRPLFLDDHLERFYHSAAQMRLPIAYSKNDLKDIIQQLIHINNMPGSGIRLTATGGNTEDGYSIATPNFIITQSPIQITTAATFEKGIRLITFPYQRQLPHVKTIDYLMAVWLQSMVKEKNADEVLYHQNEIITECPRANFFIVNKDGTLVTPVNNILKGISRKKIIEIAEQYYKVEQRDVSMEEIMNAEEAFICSTTKIILPVVAINNVPVNNGEPGPVSKRLFKMFTDITLQ